MTAEFLLLLVKYFFPVFSDILTWNNFRPFRAGECYLFKSIYGQYSHFTPPEKTRQRCLYNYNLSVNI